MSKVMVILASVLAFGWVGLYLARLYMDTHGYLGGHRYFLRWETSVMGISLAAR